MRSDGSYVPIGMIVCERRYNKQKMESSRQKSTDSISSQTGNDGIKHKSTDGSNSFRSTAVAAKGKGMQRV